MASYPRVKFTTGNKKNYDYETHTGKVLSFQAVTRGETTGLPDPFAFILTDDKKLVLKHMSTLTVID